ncbi:unnamed protein product [Arctia plantaginis]|uniref:Uncharacterized protein n=1 Tax=Arctia plantaginis TaxID=874455 RepID=A0A8S0ZIS9_ARCPL|nr:unnamed protein product [Arctia plantaginis]
MVKPIKSGVRELLYNMISKFQDMKEQHDVVLGQKRLCLQDIEKLTCSISDELKPHLQVTLQKLKALEELTINSENQYIKKIASMTGVSERTLRVIKMRAKIIKESGGLLANSVQHGQRKRKRDENVVGHSGIKKDAALGRVYAIHRNTKLLELTASLPSTHRCGEGGVARGAGHAPVRASVYEISYTQCAAGIGQDTFCL